MKRLIKTFIRFGEQNPEKIILYLFITLLFAFLHGLYPIIRFTNSYLNDIVYLIILTIPFWMLKFSFGLTGKVNKVVNIALSSVLSMITGLLFVFLLFIFSLSLFTGPNPYMHTEIKLENSYVRCYLFNGAAFQAYSLDVFQEIEILPFVVFVKKIHSQDPEYDFRYIKIDSNTISINGNIYELKEYIYF